MSTHGAINEPLSIPPVLPWALMEDAAGQLFSIWRDGHDLCWARAAWSLLPSSAYVDNNSASDRAQSLITMMALALISAQFAEAACDEAGVDPTYCTRDVMMTLELELFHLGQLYPWEPPTGRNNSVDVRLVVGELALERVAPLMALVSSHHPPDAALLRFFCIVPGAPGGDTVSEIDPSSPLGALQWFSNGFPIDVIRS